MDTSIVVLLPTRHASRGEAAVDFVIGSQYFLVVALGVHAMWYSHDIPVAAKTSREYLLRCRSDATLREFVCNTEPLPFSDRYRDLTMADIWVCYRDPPLPLLTADAEILRPCSGAVPSKLGCVRERHLGFFSIKSLPITCAACGRSSRALVTSLVVRDPGVQPYREYVVHATYMALLGVTDTLCFSCMRSEA